MSIFKVTKNDFETFTVATNPTRTYSSSSVHGVTGSVHVFSRRSSIEKEIQPVSSFVESTMNDKDLNSQLRLLQKYGRFLPSRSYNRMLDNYLNDVNEQNSSVKKQKKLDIIRFTPTVNYSSNTQRKLVVKNVLNRYYRDMYPTAHWAYTNYHSLNFFTASSVPSSSVLLYPDPGAPESVPHEGYFNGNYSLSGAFSFDFYLNPRYQQDSPDVDFKAGTLFHLSSSYAVSLVSGSARDHNGKASGFKLKLQLSHSADIPPSLSTPGSSPFGIPGDLVFESDDNALQLNKWHHCVIRWGTNLINDGTGSFNVDGVDMGTFVIPSGTVALQTASFEPKVLAVGNYYEGRYDMSEFFATTTSTRDGLLNLSPHLTNEEPNYTPGVDPISSHHFRHPLNAEVHDLAIKRYYMSDVDIAASSSVGPRYIDNKHISFYLPPFFVEESPFRQFSGDIGGIPQTPFFEIDGTTDDPFNVAMSFGVDGHYVNLENFVRDFAGNVFPRLHHLTGVSLMNTTELRTANSFLYDQPFVVKRNLTVLPCDDGTFVPSFELLASESKKSNFVDDLGVEELSFISLDRLISTGSLLFGTDFDSDTKSVEQANDFVDENIGFTPEQPGKNPGRAYLNYVSNINKAVLSGSFDPGIQQNAPLTIYNRTRDPSSNQVTFFDISNLYYGTKIKPGSFSITDVDMTGSHGVVPITLKDDGRGNIYRANTFTSQSTWNSVGNIYYDEGLVVIKSPHLYFFGKEQYEMSFKGEQNIHVLKVDALAPANLLNSSSNINYQKIKPSNDPNSFDDRFVYISNINFHDENMNVVMKAQLAQPFKKAPSDRVNFRIKMDF